MKTLNEQLETINSFNNAIVLEADTYPWGGTRVVFKSTDFAFYGIQKELGIVIERLGGNEYFFISNLPNIFSI